MVARPRIMQRHHTAPNMAARHRTVRQHRIVRPRRTTLPRRIMRRVDRKQALPHRTIRQEAQRRVAPRLHIARRREERRKAALRQRTVLRREERRKAALRRPIARRRADRKLVHRRLAGRRLPRLAAARPEALRLVVVAQPEALRLAAAARPGALRLAVERPEVLRLAVAGQPDRPWAVERLTQRPRLVHQLLHPGRSKQFVQRKGRVLRHSLFLFLGDRAWGGLFSRQPALSRLFVFENKSRPEGACRLDSPPHIPATGFSHRHGRGRGRPSERTSNKDRVVRTGRTP